MIDVLVDTNIIIYLLEDHPHQESPKIQMGGSVRYGISVVTYMELMIGAHTDRDRRELDDILSTYTIIPLDSTIARAVAAHLRGRSATLRHPQLADAVIALTALQYDVPVFTNNRKDFQRFRGLQILTP